MTRYAVLHMESNGQTPARGGRVFEAALVLVENGAIRDTCHSLMNPGLLLPPFLAALTGITPSMIGAAPASASVMKTFCRFMGDAVAVAHNASLDRQLWQQELQLANGPACQDFLCTLRLARRLYPWADSQKTAALAALHGMSPPAHHKRALDMALLKAQIFLRMQNEIALLYPGVTIDGSFLDRYQKTGRTTVRAVPEPS
jgi:DNA polymerase III subunit epsilon